MRVYLLLLLIFLFFTQVTCKPVCCENCDHSVLDNEDNIDDECYTKEVCRFRCASWVKDKKCPENLYYVIPEASRLWTLGYKRLCIDKRNSKNVDTLWENISDILEDHYPRFYKEIYEVRGIDTFQKAVEYVKKNGKTQKRVFVFVQLIKLIRSVRRLCYQKDKRYFVFKN